MNDKNQKSPVEALRRGLCILDYLGEHGATGATLGEIAQCMELKRTTAHNLLKTLVLNGYAVNMGEGRYCLGWKPRRLSNWQLLNRISHGGTQSVMSALSITTGETGESLVLAGLLNGHRHVLARTVSGQAVQVSPTYLEQKDTPIWQTETGLVLAAYSRKEELDLLVENNGFPGRHWRGICNRVDLDDALGAIRRAGGISQLKGELYAAAVPVLDNDGRLLASLGLTQPMFRHDASTASSLISTLKAGAAKVAEAMLLENEGDV